MPRPIQFPSPSPDILQQRRHLVGRHVAVDLVVDHHHRRQAAGAQAAGGFQGEDAVLAGLAQGDAQLVDDLLRDAVGPFDVAGRAQADVDDELARAASGGRNGRSWPRPPPWPPAPAAVGPRRPGASRPGSRMRLHLVQHGDQLALRMRLGRGTSSMNVTMGSPRTSWRRLRLVPSCRLSVQLIIGSLAAFGRVMGVQQFVGLSVPGSPRNGS